MSIKAPEYCMLPVRGREFQLYAFAGEEEGSQPDLALVLGDVKGKEGVTTRIHSECMTGDVFGSLRCDCGLQLSHALDVIVQKGEGALLYLRQEGRGIGLIEKIKAYRLQEQGLDTYDANVQLGHHPDARSYEQVKAMIAYLGIQSISLMTNNPKKIEALNVLGITIAQRLPAGHFPSAYNKCYLETKVQKFGHLLAYKETP